MGKAFAIMIAIGLAIGALIPLRPSAPPAKTPPVEVQPGRPAPAPAGRWGGASGETVLERNAAGHFAASVRVNGAPVRMIVDTGATIVALTIADARRAGIAVDPARFTMIGTGAGGPLRGQHVRLDRVELGGVEIRGLDAAIVEGLGVSLLGQSYLSGLGSVEISGARMVLRPAGVS